MKKNYLKCTAATLVMTGLMSMTSFAAGWQQNENGWWYATNADNTTWCSNAWQWIDGNGDGIAECYYFDANGYLLVNAAAPDGYTVDGNGAWVQNGVVQTKSLANTTAANNTIKEEDDDDDSSVTTTTSLAASTTSATSKTSSSSGSGQTLSSGAGSISSSTDYETEVDSDDLSNFARECFDLINQERTKNGVSKLKWDDTIAEACEIRAEELQEKFSHTRPDGESCFTAFDEVGIDLKAKGENIAEGYLTPKTVVKAWMNSKGHRANILNKTFKISAIGFYYDSDTNGYYWVQMFGKE